MPQSCAVPFCSEKKGGHKFPRDITLANQWLAAIRRDKYTKHSRVCKKHFNPDDYTLPKESFVENPTLKLKPNVVPSRFPWDHENEEKKEIKRKCADRVQRQKKRETATVCSTKKNLCKEYIVPIVMENNTQYHLIPVSQLRMKPECVPKKFECQPYRKKRTSDTVEPPYLLKKKRMMAIEECEKQQQESSTVSDGNVAKAYSSIDTQYQPAVSS